MWAWMHGLVDSKAMRKPKNIHTALCKDNLAQESIV